MNTLIYRREIDGLRAIAVLAVVFFHAGFSSFSGGYVGVDIFFVISGYLISSIILSNIEREDFSLRQFFIRRARRILPALFVVSLACIPMAWHLMMPYQLKDLMLSAGTAMLFVSNIFFWSKTGYFFDEAIDFPLLHTWSLSVEGQFYLVFPFFIILVWWLGYRRWFFLFILLIAVMSIGLSQWGAHNAPVANFFLAPTRAWEFLLGTLVSGNFLSRPSHNPAFNNILSLLGLALIGYSIFYFVEDMPFPSFLTLVPALGTALVISFATPTTIACNLLSFRPIVGIGLISYSLYLWHYPIISFANLAGVQPPGLALIWCLILASIIISILSWHFIERPFRCSNRVTTPLFLSISGAGLTLVIALSATGHFTNGFEKQFKQRFGNEGSAIIRALDSKGFGNVQEDGNCRFGSRNINEAFLNRFRTCARDKSSAIIVVGDSHAANLYNSLFYADRSLFLVGIFKYGCPVGGNCSYDDVTDLVREHRDSIAYVYYSQRGSYLLDWKKGQYQILEKQIVQVEQYLKALSLFSNTAWVGPQIEPGVDLRKIHPGTNRRPKQDQARMNAIQHLDALIANKIEEDGTVKYISNQAAVAYDPVSDFIIDGEYTYSDNTHWTTFGEKIFGERLVKYLRNQGHEGL